MRQLRVAVPYSFFGSVSELRITSQFNNDVYTITGTGSIILKMILFT